MGLNSSRGVEDVELSPNKEFPVDISNSNIKEGSGTLQ
jgi:hypothetical protein